MNTTQLLIGASCAALIAAAAERAHALTRSGAYAALAVGTLTFGFGGWPLTFVLLAFFISSVALSRLGRRKKKTLTDIGKAGPRDALQVLANGGIATAVGTLWLLPLAAIGTAPIADYSSIEANVFGTSVPIIAIVCAYAGAYAAATADTWGTEIGTLARQQPRSILTLRPIATGLSGGISAAGTLAELAGAAFIAGVSVFAIRQLPFAQTSQYAEPLHVFIAITAGGIAGALADSLLGATLQELRHCPTCNTTCETNPHSCQTRTRRIRGFAHFNNDTVNTAATLTGAAVAFAIAAS